MKGRSGTGILGMIAEQIVNDRDILPCDATICSLRSFYLDGPPGRSQGAILPSEEGRGAILPSEETQGAIFFREAFWT